MNLHMLARVGKTRLPQRLSSLTSARIPICLSQVARAASTSTSRFDHVENVERLDDYRPGGYHPVLIGDVIEERYKIIHKLGYGSLSTTWLAQDQKKKNRYVAVKIGTAESGYDAEEWGVDIAEPTHHEFEVLKDLAPSSSKSRSHPSTLIPEVLDQFWIEGDNGLHSCLVTTPARCSLKDLREASSSGLFKMIPARALAAQLAFAVKFVHDHGYVHGDLQLSNVLLHMPRGFDKKSPQQIYDQYGAPKPEAVVISNGEQLPPEGVPPFVFPPVWLGKPSEKLEVPESNLLLVDFGVAFRPSEETLYSYAPLELRPPEARFEPSTPLSYSSDIWSLACTIWDILAQKPLFDATLATEDDMTCEHVDALGRLPSEWWERWPARHTKFEDSGTPQNGRTPSTIHQRFLDSIQKPRMKEKRQPPEVEEVVALFDLFKSMLTFRPNHRPTIDEVLKSRWMTDWAIPACNKLAHRT